MLKFLKIFIIICMYSSMTSNVNAENKIAYIDLDYILTNSNVGKNILEKLESIENDKNEKFKIQEKKLKEEENKILASRNIITEDQLKIHISEFKKKLELYSNDKSNQINQLKKNRNKEIISLLKQINPIIEEYMSINSIALIFDKKNIYIADINYDITEDLINIINKKIKN